MNKMLSKGQNRKLAKGIGILNLTEGETCPGATELCKRVCYGKKAGRMYKTARNKRAANTLATQDPGFVGALASEIRALKVSKVRLHESGDVYDQTYLNKLLAVCRQLPDVSFLMYTKSFHLDWSGTPNNLKVYWSVDGTTKGTPPPHPRAYLVAKGEAPPPGYVTCAHTKDRHYCGDECLICWLGQDNVYFLQH